MAVAIGSNVGDRQSHLDFAHVRLGALLDHLTVSRAYETDPVGVSIPQPKFFNQAAVGETRLPAGEILDALLAIERDRGRQRPFMNAPRTLDLDLIFVGDLVIDDGRLVLPHPRFRERRFVLEPLAEIAPDLQDPVTGKTVRELLAALKTG